MLGCKGMAALSEDAKYRLLVWLVIVVCLLTVASVCYALYTNQWRWLAVTVACLIIIRPLFKR